MRHYFVSLLLFLFLVGCGGGGSSGDNSKEVSSPLREDQDKNLSVENNDSQEENNKIIGYLIDSAIEGVVYQCGEKEGSTNVEGMFSCSSFPISFYIGSIKLGSILTLPSDQKVYPQDIIGLPRNNFNSRVVKFAVLIQSFDEDQNASNGIKIVNTLHEDFTDKNIILFEDINLTSLKERYPAITFISELSALKHLKVSLGLNVQDTNSSSKESESNTIIDDKDDENGTVEDSSNSSEETNTAIHADSNTTDSSDDVPQSLKLPEAYSYPVINNLGNSVETKLDNFRVVLYSNYSESANAQSRHQGVVVLINNRNAPTMAIQATYIGKNILVAVYNEKENIVAISDAIRVEDQPIVFIKLVI